MAPHIEKSQLLISKPTTRRAGSKSPSKPPAKENDEMPEQPHEEVATRKVSLQMSQVIVPGRKISAPEMTRPPVKRGGRRNLFMERCISQEEKENIKSKPPMRKFSTPAISITNGSSKGECENGSQDSSNGGIKESKSTSIPNVEAAPKTILPVYEVCTTANKKKETCQITKPQIQENVPIPVNRINRIIKPSIDDNIKGNSRIEEDESTPTRKISMPMFHVSKEGSTTSKSETRKLYTERCISTEEKENIKSKPVKKKPAKEPLNSKQATTNQDSEIKEKVQLKPKSAQRKLSAPAKMMTPPPSMPMPSGHDLLSNGILLDIARDGDIPSLREEDGKPSFAKAAKVIHAKVQAVSCFRSSGAMPIPRLPPKIPIARPKPRKLQPPSTQEAQEIDLEIPTEIVNKLPQFDYSSLEQYLTESTEPRRSRCMIIPHPKIIDIINGFKGINEDVILRNRAVAKMPRPPPPPSEYMTSSCEKHSRCHCNLLSKKVDGFFNVTSQ